MRSFMRRLFAGVLGLVAVATMATLVGTAPAGAAVNTATPRTHDWTTSVRWPIVRKGTRSQRVVTIQYLLQARGYRLGVDGVYGPATSRAVRNFQNSRGINPANHVGPQTWRKLIVRLNLGNRGPAVRAVQHAFRFVYGFRFQVVNGFFGHPLLNRVRFFQAHSNLPVSGTVGYHTWQTIVFFE